LSDRSEEQHQSKHGRAKDRSKQTISIIKVSSVKASIETKHRVSMQPSNKRGVKVAKGASKQASKQTWKGKGSKQAND
jgi:ribulose bisphosphate carboxylase small subunit